MNRRAKWIRAGWVTLVIACGIAGLWWRQASRFAPPLFVDLPAHLKPESFPQSVIAKRHRWVYLDTAALQRLTKIGGRLKLNLFPDMEEVAVVGAHRSHPHGDQSVLGHLESGPYESLFVFSRSEQVMMGSVGMADGRQVLLSHVRGGAYVILEVDTRKVGGCGTCEPERTASKEAAPPRPSSKASAPPSGSAEGSAFARQLSRRSGAGPWSGICEACNGERTARPVAGTPDIAPLHSHTALPEPTARRQVLPKPTLAQRQLPLLAAMGLPTHVLAATGPYGIHNAGTGKKGGTGSSPVSASSRYLVSVGTSEFLDVLFLYTDALNTQLGGGATGLLNLQASVTLMVDQANQIFLESGVPFQIRQASLWKATHRAMTAMDGGISVTAPNLLGAGYPTDAPAWTETQAPVRPDYSNGDNKLWTVWNPWKGTVGVTTWNQKQAMEGVYQPTMVNVKKTEVADYLKWITNRSNSLLYGDQYWKSGKLFTGAVIEYVEANNTKQYFQQHRTASNLATRAIVPLPTNGAPMKFVGNSDYATLSTIVQHDPGSGVAGFITANTRLYFRNGNATGRFSLHSKSAHASNGSFPVQIGADDPPLDPLPVGYSLELVEQDNYRVNPFINLPAGFTWRLEPDKAGKSRMYKESVNRAVAVGPVDDPLSSTAIKAFGPGDATPPTSIKDDNATNHTPVQRYELDTSDLVPGIANGTYYGNVYNPLYSGVLGLRMDLNGSDYASIDFNGTPLASALLPVRYPNLHRFQETPFVPTALAADPRADLVILLTENLAGSAGIATKYMNITPADPARTIGRGMSPEPNKVQEKTADYHEGDLLGGSSRMLERSFTSLPVTGTINTSTTSLGSSGLVAYYPFDGNLTDSSGNAHHGVLSLGTAAYTTDRLGVAAKALSLDGTQRVEVTAGASVFNFNSTTSWAVSAWIKPNDIAAEGGILSQADSATGVVNYQMGLRNSRLSSESPPLSPVTGGNSGAVLGGTGEWKHLMYVYDRTARGGTGGSSSWTGFGKVQRYINGMLFDEIGMNAPSGVGAGDRLLLGDNAAGTAPFAGALDEVRVYSRSFTGTEVRQLYGSEKNATAFDALTGLAFHYPFNGASTADLSGNTNTGVVYNGASHPRPDRYGNANGTLSLDGVNDYMRSTKTTNFPRGPGAFTYSVWLKPGSLLSPDSRLDLLTGHGAGVPSQVFVNEGNGSLRPFVGDHQVSGTSGNATTSVAVGDLNNDGYNDFVLGNWRQPSVAFLNNGNGDFGAGIMVSADANDTRDIKLGDINRDGNLDLVVARDNGQFNLIYMGRGDGTFQPAVEIEPSSQLLFDDKIGLVVHYHFSNGTLLDASTSANHANATGLPALAPGVGPLPVPNSAYRFNPVTGAGAMQRQYITSKTANGFPSGTGNFTVLGWVNPKSFFGMDGLPDVITGVGGGPLRIHPGYGNGSFASPRTFGGVSDTTALLVRDVDGDGDPDVVQGAYNQLNRVHLLHGNGTFLARDIGTAPGEANRTLSLAMADLNLLPAVGLPDLVVGNAHPDRDVVYKNMGNGSFVKVEEIIGMQPMNPIPTGAICHFKMDGSLAADVVRDFAVNECNGTVTGWGVSVNATTSRHGRLNNAVVVDGYNGGRISWPASNATTWFGDIPALSMSLWVKPMGTQATARTVLSWTSVAYATVDGFALLLPENAYGGRFQYFSRSVNCLGGAWPAGWANTGWQHIVVIRKLVTAFNNESLEIYLNGSLNNVQVSTGPPGVNVNPSGAFALGAWASGGGQPSHFGVDDMRGYRRVLSATEILELYNESAPVFQESKGHSRSVALADLNNDGKMELIVGSDGNGTMVYQKNLDGAITDPQLLARRFGVVRYLSSGAAFNRTSSVWVGNATGGTMPDIIEGNDNASTMLYRTLGYPFINFTPPYNDWRYQKPVMSGATPIPPPGETWVARDSNRNWSAVASSSNGSKLVATVMGGQIYTSTDLGATWGVGGSAVGNWSAVASSADGVKLVAARSGAGVGQIYTSPDAGATWALQGLSPTRDWTALASSADGTKLVGVGNASELFTSTDSGANWTPRSSARVWADVAGTPDGVRLVACEAGAAGRIYVSIDSGVTWALGGNATYPVGNWAGVACSDDGFRMVAVMNGGQVYTSVDVGTTWTPQVASPTAAWKAIGANLTAQWLVGVTTGGNIYTSTDSGATWRASDSARAWTCVASSSNGMDLVAGVNGGQIYTSNALVSGTRAIRLMQVMGPIATQHDVVSGRHGNASQIYAGNGTGFFASGLVYSGLDDNTTAIEIADMNRDGIADILAANEDGPDKVYLGDGAGNFQTMLLPGSAGNSTCIGAGDFTGPGRQTIFANRRLGAFELHLNAGDSTRPTEAAMEFYTAGDDVTPLLTSANMTWDPNQWYFVAVRREGDVLTLFRDGVAMANATDASGLGNTATLAERILDLGYRPALQGGHFPLNGNVDDFRIYTKPLSDSEIAQLYNMNAPTLAASTELVGHYSFDYVATDNPVGTVLRDESGRNNNGTLGGATAPLPTFDKLGRAASALLFDGVDDVVTIAPATAANFGDFNINATQNLTVALWALPNTLSKPNNPILTLRDGSGNAYYQMEFNSSIFATAMPPVGPAGNGTFAVNPGWRFLVLVLDRTASEIRRYVDTRLCDVIPISLPAGTLTGTQLVLGANDASDAFFEGVLDDLRIYNRALSPGEVAQLYQKMPSDIPTDSRGVAMADLNNDGDLDLFFANYNQESIWFENNGTGGFPLARRIYTGDIFRSTSIAVGSINGDATPDLVLGNEGQPSVWYRSFGSGDAFNPKVNVSTDANQTQAVLLVNVVGTAALDLVSINRNEPSKIYQNLGGAWSLPSFLDPAQASYDSTSVAAGDVDGDGLVDLVVGNNGVANRVYKNNLGTFANGIAITSATTGNCTAVALADFAGDRRVLLSNQKDAGGRADAFSIHLLPLDKNNTAHVQYYAGGLLMTESTTDWNFDPASWHHLVVTRRDPFDATNPNGVRMYLNGSSIGTGTAAMGNSAIGAAEVIDTGYRKCTDQFPMKGELDDLRLYNRALNDAEVVELNLADQPPPPNVNPYQGLVAWYRLAANGLDSAGVYNLHGTMSGPVPTVGVVNDSSGALEFNGSRRDVVNVGHHAALNGNASAGLSFTAWVKTSSAGTLSGTLAAKDGTIGSCGWRVEVNATTGRVQFLTSPNGTTVNTLVGVQPVNDGAWHHVVVTIGPGGRRIYVDGFLDGSSGAGTALFATTAEFMLGMDSMTLPTVNGPLTGRLDEARVYDAEISAARVAAIHAAEKPGIEGYATIRVHFVGDRLTAGDSVRLELFNDVDTKQAPFFSQIFTTGGDSITHTFMSNATGNAWQNLRGAWRLKGIAGSITADSVDIEVRSGQFVFGLTQTMNQVPGQSLYNFNAQINRDVYSAGVVQLSQATAQYSFCHEIGHLLSASHGMGDDVAVGILDASHTFSPFGSHFNYVRDEYLSMGNHFTAFGGTSGAAGTFGKFCTIMAYTRNGVYKRIPYYSSPRVVYLGVQTGHSRDHYLPPPFGNFNQALYMDNVRAMGVVGKVVVQYRDVNGTGRPVDPSTVPAPFTPPQGVPLITTMATAPVGGNATQVAVLNPANPTTPADGLKPPATTPGTSGGSPASGTNPITTPKASSPGSPTGRQPSTGLGGATGSTGTKPPAGGTIGGTTPTPQPTPTNTTPRPTVPVIPTTPRVATVPNDQFENSILLQPKPLADASLLASDNGHNMGATGGANESAGLRSDDGRQVFYGKSVWWVMQAAREGEYELEASTQGSNIDTTLSVFLPGMGAPLSNDNGAGVAPASRVVVPRVRLKAGDRVYFAVDGVDGAEGRLRISVRLKPVNAAGASKP